MQTKQLNLPLIFIFLLLLLGATGCGVFNQSSENEPLVVNLSQLEEMLAGGFSADSILGVWGNAETRFNEHSNDGYLVLILDPEDDPSDDVQRVIGFSTTGQTLWQGAFEDGLLRARYVQPEVYTGSVNLQLSEDGTELSGEWNATEYPASGTYSAFRIDNLDFAMFEQHVNERMRNLVIFD